MKLFHQKSKNNIEDKEEEEGDDDGNGDGRRETLNTKMLRIENSSVTLLATAITDLFIFFFSFFTFLFHFLTMQSKLRILFYLFVECVHQHKMFGIWFEVSHENKKTFSVGKTEDLRNAKAYSFRLNDCNHYTVHLE